jgi:hypothetical protein
MDPMRLVPGRETVTCGEVVRCGRVNAGQCHAFETSAKQFETLHAHFVHNLREPQASRPEPMALDPGTDGGTQGIGGGTDGIEALPE